MKALKLLILLLISFSSYSQYYQNIITPIKWTKGGFDSLFIPARDTITPSDRTKAWIVYRAPVLYVWTNTKWTSISAGSGGSDYILPQADSNTLGGIRYNTDFALDVNNRLGIAPGKKALWNTIANLTLFYATGDSTRKMIHDSLAAHPPYKFNEADFYVQNDTVYSIDKVSGENDPIFTASPAGQLNDANVIAINNLNDTTLHPPLSLIQRLINEAKDSVYFNSNHFTGDGSEFNPINLRLKKINGNLLWGDGDLNIAGGASGGGETDTTSLSNRINQKLNITDTTILSNRINANTTAIATKLNISDTANIRLRPVAGTNMTITGTYPNLTFNSTASGGSGITTLSAIGSSPNANGATITGSTLNLEPASSSFGGVVTAANQTFGGIKTFSNIIIPGSTTSSTLRVGTLEFQGYSLGNSWFGDNVYWNGTSFTRRVPGRAGMFYFLGDGTSGNGSMEGQFKLYDNGTGSTGINSNIAQLKINMDGTFAVGAAISNNPGTYTGANFTATSKGVMVTKMTTSQMNAVASPTNGLLIFNTDSLSHFQYANGWQNLKSAGGSLYTDAQARAAITLTTTGTSGAATYNNSTGVLNVPNYAFSGGSSFIKGGNSFGDTASIGLNDNNILYFKANNTQAGRITPTGKWSFGAVPSDTLTAFNVSGQSTFSRQIKVSTNSGSDFAAFYGNIPATNGNYLARVDEAVSSNTGIGFLNGNLSTGVGFGLGKNGSGLLIGTGWLDIVHNSFGDINTKSGNVKFSTGTTSGTLALAMTITQSHNLLIGTATDLANTILNINSTSQGVLLPRMTKAQRDAIVAPGQGLIVFVTDNGGYLSWYNGGWQKVNSTAD